GYLEQASVKLEQALTLARNITHPFSLASAWHCAAEVHRQRGEAQASLECAERELELSREQGFPLWLALAQIYRGWALARLGRHKEALAHHDPAGNSDLPRDWRRNGGADLPGPAGRRLRPSRTGR